MRTFQIIYNDVKQYNVARTMIKIILVGVLSLLLYSAVDSTGATAQARESDTVTGMIKYVFGPYAAGALRVARCESGLNARAYNRIAVWGSHSVGVFQILYPSTWRGTAQAARSPYNAWANILAAHEIFVRDGHTWREWVSETPRLLVIQQRRGFFPLTARFTMHPQGTYGALVLVEENVRADALGHQEC